MSIRLILPIFLSISDFSVPLNVAAVFRRSSFRFAGGCCVIFIVSCLVDGLTRLNMFLKLASDLLLRLDDLFLVLLDRSLRSDLSEISGETNGGVGGSGLCAVDRLGLVS